jgi:hypothetical protein
MREGMATETQAQEIDDLLATLLLPPCFRLPDILTMTVEEADFTIAELTKIRTKQILERTS